ncbi:Esterase [Pseudomonas sp. 9AZ]|jgi:acyl-coenzyme A thioesterase 13|uniref:PaaI family thioesterase n=1 Tax=Pseudomonas sp. 9AZ TaxID=2653168 RepID=UPI0012F31734|nr:PaaI family thioesterase [Pseudomonas sp. 9AZ]VXD03170.1 Esterase [Pseudomonas sp. 9AZ]
MSMVPEGFTRLFRSSPFLDLLGPIYNQRTDKGLVIGLWAEEKHCNARGLVHGGVLSSLADVALGYNSAFAQEPPTPIVTSSLTIDYAGTAKRGDWITLETDVQKVGKSLAFANCYVVVESVRIARASAVFSVVTQ